MDDSLRPNLTLPCPCRKAGFRAIAVAGKFKNFLYKIVFYEKQALICEILQHFKKCTRMKNCFLLSFFIKLHELNPNNFEDRLDLRAIAFH